MDESRTGLILKGIGGFYYVETQQGIVECRARGVFRNRGLTPLAGDRVSIRVSSDGSGAVEEIAPRRNFLVRPAVANIDQLVIVVSTCEPNPNPFLIDRAVAEAEILQIKPVLVFSKTDLHDAGRLCGIYANAGFRLFCVSPDDGKDMETIRGLLVGKTTAFTGNTGVGKSTLLNGLYHGLNLPTGEISKKLGRGRHTTRQVELYPLPGGGYVIDTPGFSSSEGSLSDVLTSENLADCFREFQPYRFSCRFDSCTHIREKGCAVLEAVEEGKISRSRYESYAALFQELKEKKPWMKKEKNV